MTDLGRDQLLNLDRELFLARYWQREPLLIKNAIVLIDEINAQLASGAGPMEAILASGTSRLRPVAMAASTTALGMLPLFFDAFFVSMAVTIVFGLVCATVLTMIVVPVFYAIVYRIK